jgi:hypothetical protein
MCPSLSLAAVEQQFKRIINTFMFSPGLYEALREAYRFGGKVRRRVDRAEAIVYMIPAAIVLGGLFSLATS